MIFITVGTDSPFNRMIKIIDHWAKENNREDIFAQIGDTDWSPSYIKYSKFLDPAEFAEKLSQADYIVSHAGMGTILTALKWQKPILVFPRRASLGEQRNEHQLATANKLLSMEKINVAFEADELKTKLNNLSSLQSKGNIGEYASPSLISCIQNFINPSDKSKGK
ncbi:hypothetical protein MLD52_15020 [Puniceicoccaceae bacterium K14]|nr:hypothetical protein [Puniceicoccaceae bacterium K14]